MKRILLTTAISMMAASSFAQWSNSANNTTSGELSIGNYQRNNTELTIKSNSSQIGRSSLVFDFNTRQSGLRSAKLSELSTTLALYHSLANGTIQDIIYVSGEGKVGIGQNFYNPISELQVKGKITTDQLDVNGTIKATDELSIGNFQRNNTELTIKSNSSQISRSSLVFDFNTRQSGLRSAKLSELSTTLALYHSLANGKIQDIIYVSGEGKVGIGENFYNPTSELQVKGKITTDQLDVNGTIRAREVKVEVENWSDFVFDKDYKLPSLHEVEAHINEHKHLPNIPSETEVKEEGINLSEMQAKLLLKIEELTLYVIEQNKKIELQDKRLQRSEQLNEEQSQIINHLKDKLDK